MGSTDVTRLTTLGVCLLCLAGCGSAGGGTQGSDSGVSGITVVDRGCAVIRGSTPCPTEPLRARVAAVRMGSSGTAAETESGADGRFRMSLEPGHYELRARNLTGAPVPTAMPTKVDVPGNGFVDVTIHFDSGVRAGG